MAVELDELELRHIAGSAARTTEAGAEAVDQGVDYGAGPAVAGRSSNQLSVQESAYFTSPVSPPAASPCPQLRSAEDPAYALDDLPTPILARVLSNLPRSIVVALATLSSRFARAASACIYAEPVFASSAQFEAFLSRLKPDLACQMEGLIIPASVSSNLYMGDIDALLSQAPNLKRFQLRDCFHMSNLLIQSLSSYCLKLESVDVRGCPISDAFIPDLVRKAKGLKHLELSGTNCTLASLAAVLQGCQALEDLGFEGIKGDGSELGQNGLGSKLFTRPLRRIVLRNSCISDDTLRWVMDRAPALQDVDLSGTGLSDDGMIKAARLPVRALDLSFTNITDLSIAALGLNTHETLHSLNLAACTNITPKAIYQLILKCHSMDTLVLTAAPKLLESLGFDAHDCGVVDYKILNRVRIGVLTPKVSSSKARSGGESPRGAVNWEEPSRFNSAVGGGMVGAPPQNDWIDSSWDEREPPLAKRDYRPNNNSPTDVAFYQRVSPRPRSPPGLSAPLNKDYFHGREEIELNYGQPPTCPPLQHPTFDSGDAFPRYYAASSSFGPSHSASPYPQNPHPQAHQSVVQKRSIHQYYASTPSNQVGHGYSNGYGVPPPQPHPSHPYTPYAEPPRNGFYPTPSGPGPTPRYDAASYHPRPSNGWYSQFSPTNGHSDSVWDTEPHYNSSPNPNFPGNPPHYQGDYMPPNSACYSNSNFQQKPFTITVEERQPSPEPHNSPISSQKYNRTYESSSRGKLLLKMRIETRSGIVDYINIHEVWLRNCE